uniref:Uncharacterized protein n=1 Tax=Rangifer tarandus platyrhynchus TaxID=3082113 RepID=A0ACB0FN61_RANTA|nr:unnamed protein product [Rangifer tarandus platyrhynchus]
MPQFTFACFCGLHGFCKMKRKKEEAHRQRETAVLETEDRRSPRRTSGSVLKAALSGRWRAGGVGAGAARSLAARRTRWVTDEGYEESGQQPPAVQDSFPDDDPTAVPADPPPLIDSWKERPF